MIRQKTILLAAISFSLHFESYANECPMYFQDKNVIHVTDSMAGAVLGSLVFGVVLGPLVLDAMSSDIPNPAGSKNQKHLDLANFITKKMELNAVDLSEYKISQFNEELKIESCTYIILRFASVIDNYDATNTQYFKIRRIVDGVTQSEEDIKSTSRMKLALFQRRPQKRLKEDTRTGKYIDVSKKMIDASVYNEMVFEEFTRSSVENISKLIKKHNKKIQN